MGHADFGQLRECFYDFNVGNQHAGKRGKCPSCGAPVVVPGGRAGGKAGQSPRPAPPPQSDDPWDNWDAGGDPYAGADAYGGSQGYGYPGQPTRPAASRKTKKKSKAVWMWPLIIGVVLMSAGAGILIWVNSGDGDSPPNEQANNGEGGQNGGGGNHGGGEVAITAEVGVVLPKPVENNRPRNPNRSKLNGRRRNCSRLGTKAESVGAFG